MKRPYSVLCALLLGLGTMSSAQAAPATICVYDPAGKSGDYYRLLEEWTVAAASWGQELSLKTYTDEETAAKDYEAGVCDGVVATGVRLQRFNRFASSMEAIGALPDYKLLNQLVDSFVRYPSAAQYLRSTDHETVGVIPVGKVYLFVRDRQVDTVAELAGKRIATLDYDVPSKTMVDRVGAIMVPADLGSLGPKFNNGDVDACYATAPVYQPFELARGVGSSGGIVKLPLAQATLQVMVRHSKFAPDFGAKSREHWAKAFPKALALVETAEKNIPADKWITIPAEQLPAFDEMFGQVREQLKQKGAYDAKMLDTLKRLRCAADATRPECAG